MTLLVKIFAISLVWTFVQGNNQNGKELFLQKSDDEENEALLVRKESEDQTSFNCELFINNDQIDEVLSRNGQSVQLVSEDEMEKLLDKCQQIILVRNRHEPEEEEEETSTSDGSDQAEYAKRSYRRKRDTRRAASTRSNNVESTTESETTTAGYEGIPVIFPGTKWCGAGDRAKSYDDLGVHQDTDRCCRAHDLCNDTLAPGETRNNLTNKSPFTTLSCQCDNDFYNCLSRVNSVTSNTIGNMYFNILRRQCYEEDYPTTKKCKKYTSFLKITCREFEKDTKAPKEYTFVKAKKYKKIPFPGPITVTLPF